MLRANAPCLLLVPLVVVPLLLAFAVDAPDDPPKASWDVEQFFREHPVVDGNVNYYSPTLPHLGQPDFRRVKAEVGIDIGSFTVSSPASLGRQWNRFQDGKYQGALLIRNRKDLESALEKRQYGVLFYSQTHFKLDGDPKRIEAWYRAGLRVFLIQYGSTDGNQDPAERLGGGSDQDGGLTELGRRVVRELARLHIVIDVAHCNEQTILETAALATELGVPVIASHTATRTVRDSSGQPKANFKRNISERGMRAIRDAGGVVGIMAYMPSLNRLQDATIADLVDHLEHAINVVGAKHVGLSTDGYLDGTMVREHKSDGVLDGPRRWKEAVRLLHERGHSDAELRQVMGGNFLRVYRQVLAPE